MGAACARTDAATAAVPQRELLEREYDRSLPVWRGLRRHLFGDAILPVGGGQLALRYRSAAPALDRRTVAVFALGGCTLGPSWTPAATRRRDARAGRQFCVLRIGGKRQCRVLATGNSDGVHGDWRSYGAAGRTDR